MPKVQDTITEVAHGLHQAGMLDKQTMRTLTDADLPEIYELTGKEIQELRERENLSQPVFAGYLNVSPSTIKSLEQGNRQAQGPILLLLNLIDKKGLEALR